MTIFTNVHRGLLLHIFYMSVGISVNQNWVRSLAKPTKESNQKMIAAFFPASLRAWL
jgi:hypothetical protein